MMEEKLEKIRKYVEKMHKNLGDVVEEFEENSILEEYEMIDLAVTEGCMNITSTLLDMLK